MMMMKIILHFDSIQCFIINAILLLIIIYESSCSFIVAHHNIDLESDTQGF